MTAQHYEGKSFVNVILTYESGGQDRFDAELDLSSLASCLMDIRKTAPKSFPIFKVSMCYDTSKPHNAGSWYDKCSGKIWSDTIASFDQDLIARYNTHETHLAAIRELCEALSKINSLCLQGDSGEIHNDRAVEYIEDIARSTLAKHQPKDKKC